MTAAKPSTIDMTRAGIAEIQMEAMPTRLVSRAKPPAKAAKVVFAGTDSNNCHFAARTERPRTMAAKMSTSRRMMRETNMLRSVGEVVWWSRFSTRDNRRRMCCVVVVRQRGGQLINGKRSHKQKRSRDCRPLPCRMQRRLIRRPMAAKANHRAGDCAYSSSEVRTRVRVCPYNSFTDGSRHGCWW
jgi:hypothetical protein